MAAKKTPKKSTKKTAYVPGVCNINRAEVAYRKRIGWLLTLVFISLLAALLTVGLGRWIRLALFIPAVGAAESFLQAKHQFCVSYAAANQQHADNDALTAVTVTSEKAIAKDLARARQINLQAAAIALVVTLLALMV